MRLSTPIEGPAAAVALECMAFPTPACYHFCRATLRQRGELCDVAALYFRQPTGTARERLGVAVALLGWVRYGPERL
jgi:hypothetical protein